MKFGDEEHPTQPARPTPVELAQQAWLANASRAIRGSLRTATNRWRVIAVAAVEGGAARVSEVDLIEVASQGQTADDAVPGSDSDSDSDPVAVSDSDSDSVAVSDSDSAAAAAIEPAPSAVVAPASNRASPEHAIEIVDAVASFEIAAEPLSRRDLGPRGTMRMADAQLLLRNWGPKGTVKLHTRRRPSAAASRAARTFVLPKPSRWGLWLAAGISLALAGALVSVVLVWGM